MRKALSLLALTLIFGCSSTKTSSSTKLYEILAQEEDGGGNIQFYEILTEPKEIVMLQNDENIKAKIKSEDVTNANFIVLNMGEKRSGGFSITVDSVEETADKIIVSVKESSPESGSMVTQVITYPYCIVKINSKKEIVIK